MDETVPHKNNVAVPGSGIWDIRQWSIFKVVVQWWEKIFTSPRAHFFSHPLKPTTRQHTYYTLSRRFRYITIRSLG